MFYVSSIPPSKRQHVSYDVHLEVKREDYHIQNCSVLCCVQCCLFLNLHVVLHLPVLFLCLTFLCMFWGLALVFWLLAFVFISFFMTNQEIGLEECL